MAQTLIRLIGSRSILAAIMFAAFSACTNTQSSNTSASPSPSAWSVPSATPTVATDIPTHIPIYADVAGCYHNSNGNCPAPLAGPTASSAQVQSDITTLAKYVDIWQTDLRAVNYAHAAGIFTVAYFDIFQLHENACCLAANSFASNLIAKDKQGNQIYSPWANQTNGGSFLGDPAAGPGNLADYLNGLISQQVHAQYGPFAIDGARLDDGNQPGRTTSYQSYCAGFFANGGKTAACNSSHPAVTASTAPYLSYPPYNADWIAGYKATVAKSSLPVIVNGGTDPSYGWLAQPNVKAVECETCITHTNEPTWVNQMNAGLTFQHLGVAFHLFRIQENNSQDAGLAWTSAAMMYEIPRGVIMTEQVASSISPPSNNGAGGNIATNPLMYIVPTQWIGPDMHFDWKSYNYDKPTTNVGIGLLKTSTGAYAREALQCAIAGRPAGPCAFVVNPTTATVAWPKLSQHYTRAIRYDGLGAITPFGDTGSLNTNAGAPPATLPPGSGLAVLL